MKITEEIKEAILKAADVAGGQRQLAEKSDTSQSNISRYLSGSTLQISPENMVKLWPLLELHLSENRRTEINKIITTEMQSSHDKNNLDHAEIRELTDRISYLEGQVDTLMEIFRARLVVTGAHGNRDNRYPVTKTEVTPELREAISAASLAAGSQNLLAQQVGVPQQNISRYIAGTVSSVTMPNLIKLWPFVKDFLPSDQRAKTFALINSAAALNCDPLDTIEL